MEKRSVDQEFADHQQTRAEQADMVKQAFANMAKLRDGMSNHDVALDLVKKAHYEDVAAVSRTYSAEAQVYATLALADAMTKLAEALQAK